MTTTTDTTQQQKKMVAPTMFYAVTKTRTGEYFVLTDIHGKSRLVTRRNLRNFPKMPSKSILKLAYERKECIAFYGTHWYRDGLDVMELFKQGRLV